MIKAYLAIGILSLAGCGDPGLGGNQDLASPDLANPDLAPSVPRVHRAEAPTCPDTRPAIDCKDLTGQSMCSGDDTCTSGVNGRCAGNGHDRCSCSYDTCTTDADCPGGQLCDCRNTWHYGVGNGPNRCLQANCRTDADCGPGGFCSPSLDPDCGSYVGVTGYYCHTAADTCHNDDDCPGDMSTSGYGGPFCTYRPEVGHWACAYDGCIG